MHSLPTRGDNEAAHGTEIKSANPTQMAFWNPCNLEKLDKICHEVENF